MSLFEEEVKRQNVTNFSKSLMQEFETCNLKAWLNINNPNKYQKKSEAIIVGSIAHLLFGFSLQQHLGIKTKEPKMPKKTNPLFIYKAWEKIKSFNFSYLLRDVEAKDLIGIEVEVSVELFDNNRLNGIFDAVLLKEDKHSKKNYIEIIEYKSSPRIESEMDIESLIYTYLAYKEYGLDVSFKRVNEFQTASFYHTVDEIEKMEEMIINYIKEAKEILENYAEPEMQTGAHCSFCPFISRCKKRVENIENFDNLVDSIELLKAELDSKKAQLKQVLKTENLEDFVAKKYEIVKKPQTQYRLKRGVTKQDVIKALIMNGKMDAALPNMDVKIDGKIAEELKSLNIEVKPLTKVYTSVVPLKKK
jgi:CRISPR/Cas system-associated exonuclease Cas4 (RecB family)